MILTIEALEKMNIKAKTLLAHMGYDIPDYTVQIDTAKSRAGQCNFKSQTISISEVVARFHSESEVFDTVVHEWLHAIAYESYSCSNHTGAWKRLANEVNTIFKMNIERCYMPSEEQEKASTKYSIKCNSCGHVNKYQRRTAFVKAAMSGNTKGYKCSCGGTHFEMV